MRILITNDDGISAPGLAVAEEIAATLAGPDGEVWVVAPAFEQSGVAHCISYVRPMRLERLGPRRFAVEGSPADCVLAGACEILRDTPPDLILSGVNRGHNVAEDTLYSGTVGGAMEGALHGFRAIAMSQYYGPPSPGSDPFDAAREHGAAVCRRLIDSALWNDRPYGLFYNVNFPAAARERGPRLARGVPGPSPVRHLHRRAADRAERPPVPLARPRPRQRRHARGLGRAPLPRRLRHRDAAARRPDRARPGRPRSPRS